MAMDYNKSSYVYAVHVSSELYGSQPLLRILESSTDISVISGNDKLSFECIRSTEGLRIIPLRQYLSTYEYDMNSFLEFCEMQAIPTIMVSSSYNYTSHSNHIKLQQSTNYIDYSLLIDYLLTHGIVKTKNSKSFLTTDGRMFSVIKTHPKVKAYLKLNPELKDEIKGWFEVDCLGSALCLNLTQVIEDIANMN